jgi:2-hydroxycyclohexanecarboxyl-CoA dehydrogenase
MNILDLSGRCAIVTGAGQGVGHRIALTLAECGARVIVNDYFEERAHAVAKEIGEGQAVGIGGDVTNFDSVKSLTERALAAFGKVDILVNNAGNAGAGAETPTGRPFWEQDPWEWDAFVGVNFTGVMNGCRAVLPGMIANANGSIINIISDAGRVGEAGLEVYSGAKAGAAGFTRAIARSTGRFGVRANCVAIATTRTPTTAAFLDNPDFAKRALSKYVIRRFGAPDDVANMVAFLASDTASGWITGQTYPVNGGFDMGM